ncbi:MAG: hypothetical protein ACM3SX_23280 [Deltaproteobacteria bacterium]
MVLASCGIALIILATLARTRGSSRWIRPRVIAGLTMLLALSSITAVPAAASHTVITTADSTWFAFGNGLKIYLSSPRHTDSGSRGECGWEENINGRHWNYYAASVNTGGGYGSFYSRTYDVTVSANSRDDLYTSNVTSANNWGADAYIVTHTNANNGCPDSASYLLVMYKSNNTNSIALKNELLTDLDPATPGGTNNWTCDNLGIYECIYVNTWYRAYVELFFHTNSSAVSWFQGNGTEGSGGVQDAWRYGYAIDHLWGYPR